MEVLLLPTDKDGTQFITSFNMDYIDLELYLSAKNTGLMRTSGANDYLLMMT